MPRKRPRRPSPRWPYYWLLFFAESPSTPFPRNAAEYTSFSAAIADGPGHRPHRRAARAGSLGLDASDRLFADQDLADAAGAAAVEVIRYASVRDPEGGANAAVLTCLAFASTVPTERQTWRLRISRSGVQAICQFPNIRIGFDRSTFAADPRLAAFNWDR